jgi:hypothetical protein
MACVLNVADPPDLVKQSATTALEVVCKNVIDAKEKRLSTWEVDVLIVDTRQTL